MLTESVAHGFSKKLDIIDYRLNSFGRITGDGLELERKTCELPSGLGPQFLGITRELGMRYGAIDMVGDDAGNYYVIDVNSTPSLLSQLILYNVGLCRV